MNDPIPAPKILPKGTNLVLFLERDDVWESADGALHAVDALHHDEDLLPGPVGARVAVHDRPAQLPLQVTHVCRGGVGRQLWSAQQGTELLLYRTRGFIILIKQKGSHGDVIVRETMRYVRGQRDVRRGITVRRISAQYD